MKVTGLKITKYATSVLFATILLHLGGLGTERATFLNLSLAWGTWFFLGSLVYAGDFSPPMTTVRSYLKGLLASLSAGFIGGLVYLLLDKVL